MRSRLALAGVFCSSVLACVGAPREFADGDMEQPGVAAWSAYGTPTVLEKTSQAHGGTQALRVATDNQEAMGGGFEGVSRSLGEFEAGDRVRVSFWLRPLAGREVWIGMGRTSFEQIWRLFDTDWMAVVCDFRVRVAGRHAIWITQQGAPNEFLLDDMIVERIPALDLGTAAEADRVAVENAGARLWFCRRTGALCGLENLATGEVAAALGRRQPLFGLGVLRAGGTNVETVDFGQARLTACRPDPERRWIELDFAIADPAIGIACRIAAGEDGAFLCTGRLENRSDTTILDFSYPEVAGVRPARDPEALTLVHPYLCGQIVPRALSSTGCNATYPGRGGHGLAGRFGRGGAAWPCSSAIPRAPAPG